VIHEELPGHVLRPPPAVQRRRGGGGAKRHDASTGWRQQGRGGAKDKECHEVRQSGRRCGAQSQPQLASSIKTRRLCGGVQVNSSHLLSWNGVVKLHSTTLHTQGVDPIQPNSTQLSSIQTLYCSDLVSKSEFVGWDVTQNQKQTRNMKQSITRL